MTTQKDFKRLVRGRMQKTGESYTTARAIVLQKAQGNGHPVDAKAIESNGHGPKPATVPPDLAKIAGMADEKIKEKTGCTWEKWVWALDHVGAFNWPHGEIARYVHEKYDVPGWWTQCVTVGYERIKGLRERGQRRGGSWEASKSKTVDASVGSLFNAWKQPRLRKTWLPDQKIAIRTAVPNKSMRITWPDGTSVEVYFTSKSPRKSSVAVQHTKLPSKEAAEQLKAFWAERLEVLASQLRPATRRTSKRSAGLVKI